ncbi:right-handed parallel beta-helix repeat-containing protein [Pseudenhygromyxa sp. WMMC2535]|uniref:right-handed parallel beta-helix repeat-containing protein n=1 Tax=Pseudenhygromyxa sp. WMMC2535 TaxID=2712867 RepID=UPI0015565AA8|nr:right-handed parallel beta-helix repeat-containing protein [Pseudenhygromyxa sp. WMMC2535]NVB40857.1 right-handed parallel beta-helix repeat-containing protein [Pseudenhygromyxa sp. WMMC2535]
MTMTMSMKGEGVRRRAPALAVVSLATWSLAACSPGSEDEGADENSGEAIGFEVPDFNPGADEVSGTVWHVAVAGDDAAGDGSEASPWASVSRALEAVAPGDGVAIHVGTYSERVAITVSGEAERYISIYAAGDGEVVFDGAGVDLDEGEVGQWVRGLVHVHDAGYVRISGLRIIHSSDNAIAASLAHHVVIEGCETYDSVSSGLGIWSSSDITAEDNAIELACNDGGQECISVAGSSLRVALVGNEVFNGGPGSQGGEGIDIKGGGETSTAESGLPQGPREVYVVGNRVHDINRGCLYADAWDADVGPVVFANNEVYDCDGAGMAAAGESGGHLHDVVFANNLVYRSLDRPEGFGSSGVVFAYNWGSATATLSRIAAVHNTFYNMRWACGRLDADALVADATAQLVFEDNLCVNADGPVFASDDNDNEDLALTSFDRLGHNLLWFIDPEDATGYYAGEVFVGPDSVVADPAFLGALAGTLDAESFQLGASSPAAGAGVTAAEAPALDFAGVTRADPPSIGAFEAQ